MQVAWVLEPEVFSVTYQAIVDAVRHAGHKCVLWQDDWWANGSWPRLADHAVVFHGSLGNAARIRADLPWRPGAFCDTPAFHCSVWYSSARQWLLHRQWEILPANSFIQDRDAVLTTLGGANAVFVRPDSPLKPFSGRVLNQHEITLTALDYGFYYDDASLPIVAAPVRPVQREWRYVVVDGRVVAGSSYSTEGRMALGDDPGGAPWQFADEVSADIPSPEDVYVMDVCQSDGQLRLLELNPFSGADLYACNPEVVVRAVSEAAVNACGG